MHALQTLLGVLDSKLPGGWKGFLVGLGAAYVGAQYGPLAGKAAQCVAQVVSGAPAAGY